MPSADALLGHRRRFNPRPREGDDPSSLRSDEVAIADALVSIHVPVKGTTIPAFGASILFEAMWFQSTSP